MLEESKEVGDHRIADIHGIPGVARLALEREHRLIILVAVRSRGTAQYGTAFFGRAEAPGNPWKSNSIFAMTGTVKFTGPDKVTVNYIINVYPVNVPGFSNADSDGDGFPDPDA